MLVECVQLRCSRPSSRDRQRRMLMLPRLSRAVQCVLARQAAACAATPLTDRSSGACGEPSRRGPQHRLAHVRCLPALALPETEEARVAAADAVGSRAAAAAPRALTSRRRTRRRRPRPSSRTGASPRWMPRRMRRRRAPRGRSTRARPRARPGPARRRSSTMTAATHCAPRTSRAACGPACCACGPRVRRAGCGPKGAPSAAAAAGGRHALRARAGHEGWVVGGAVRDLLLSTRPKDFDILTTATPAQARGRPGRPARAWRAGARSRRCLCLRRGPQGASWGLRGRLRGSRVRR